MIDLAGTPVRHHVEVDATIERAFDVFTSMTVWWPPEHRLMDSELREVVIEPRVGGRCYQVGVDDAQCDWGKVLVWEPPRRLVVAWHLTSRFEFDPDGRRASEVEVGFEPLAERRCRVTLEHRCFDRHGPDGDALRAAVDTPNGWSSILGRFAECPALR